MSWKEDYMKRYGEEGYEEKLAQSREWKDTHREERKDYAEAYYENHLEDAIVSSRESSRKGGKHYDRHLEYQHTGIPGEKNKIRGLHNRRYGAYKKIIAPESQIHHTWLDNGTAEYSCVALVEATQHRHGLIDVIEILEEGGITLLAEEEIREQVI